MRPACLLGAALLLLACAGPALATDALTARLLTRGTAATGAEIEVQVEVSWAGRPERAAPTIPTITVPEGAGLRLGRTGSSFDGSRSRWWTNSTVTLPDQGAGPWSIGPAVVTVALAGGGEQVVTAPARVLGRAPRRGLVGQALASGVVLAAAIAAFLAMFRRLRPAPGDAPLHDLVAAVQTAMSADDAAGALELAITLHGRLAEHRVARDYLPPLQGLTERREATRFGGEDASMRTLTPLVGPLLVIAGALLDPEAPR